MKTRKFLAIFSCFLISSALARSDFEKAEILERKGEILEALKIYKKLAQSALEESRSEVKSKNLASEAKPKQTETSAAESENLASERRSDLDEILGIKTYEPLFFAPASVARQRIEGRKRFESQFSLSFQKPVFYDILGLNESLNFAYSQTSWWQTAQGSTPFRETNYRPEIFIQAPVNFETLPQLESLKIGLLHESNGQGGELSRSWNRLYASGEFKLGELAITPRFWTIVGDRSDNRDIARYMGYGDLRFKLKFKEQILTALIRNNLRSGGENKGAYELGWMFPLGSGIYGYAKIFSGYGESLIDYDRKLDKFSLGISILR